jgi:RNA polymerase sigma-70 factor (ECF subfamily)
MSASNESRFPETRWTRVRSARDAQNPGEAREAFERLCRDYWSPLYAYARAIGLVPEDAQRLVNELFYRMTYELFPIHHPGEMIPDIPREQLPIGKQRDSGDNSPLLERAEGYSGKNREIYGDQAGRLRDFFMLQIKTIAHTDWRSSKRQSQDGCIFSTEDVAKVEHELSDEMKAMQSSNLPDEIFRRRWRRTLLQRARQALKQEMERKGELPRFQVLWPLVDRDDADNATSQQAAERLGMTDGGVRAAVSRLRDNLRDHILRQIADTVDSDDPAALEDEVRALFS